MEMYFETRNRFIIALAWGPRRVTSNTRYGSLSSAYPSRLSAAGRMWWRWITGFGEPPWSRGGGLYRWLTWDFQIVLPQRRATARTAASIKGIDRKPEAPALEKSEIEALLRQRLDLREKRDFAGADKIRGQLVDAGVSVTDQAI